VDQAFTMGKCWRAPLFKLRPTGSGNPGDHYDAEQVVQQCRH
jgi:hypothetical protein